MTILLCVDNNFGIKFNKRRQSKDKEVIRKIYEITKGKRLFIDSFSSDLFEKNKVEICDKFPQNAIDDDYFFTENPEFCDFSKIDKIILFCWNTVYPSDVKFALPKEFKIVTTCEFKGNSHDKITEVIYEKV